MKYEIKVFKNTKEHTYIECITGSGGFSKFTADLIARDVNAVLYQLAVSAYAEVAEILE